MKDFCFSLYNSAICFNMLTVLLHLFTCMLTKVVLKVKIEWPLWVCR